MFTGPMREVRQFNLSVKLPSLEPWWTVEMRQPVMEIQALAEAEGNLSREWSAYAVHEYEHSKIFALEFFGLYQAHNIITPQSLRGVIDVIRSKALEFALDLQSADPTAARSVGRPSPPSLRSRWSSTTSRTTSMATALTSRPAHRLSSARR